MRAGLAVQAAQGLGLALQAVEGHDGAADHAAAMAGRLQPLQRPVHVLQLGQKMGVAGLVELPVGLVLLRVVVKQGGGMGDAVAAFDGLCAASWLGTCQGTTPM